MSIPRLPTGFSHPFKIGGGGFAVVYRARQTALSRNVAIKVIAEPDKALRHKLLTEATVQAQLKIDCIPQIYDAFERGSTVCIVMQWVDGIRLTQVLATPLTASRRLFLAQTVISAVAALHGQGYAHRDIKPDNIMISPGQGVFLIDFGLTKSISAEEQTMAGLVKGTPAYMAPEMWHRSDTTDLVRADMYSLGKVLSEILEDLPQREAVRCCLAHRPEERPSSAVELRRDWNGYVANGDWSALCAVPAAGALSQQLYDGARVLLDAHRNSEAYDLLVECIEMAPDMAPAVALLAHFPAVSRSTYWGRAALIGSVAALVGLMVVIAFWAGQKSAVEPRSLLHINTDQVRLKTQLLSSTRRSSAVRSDYVQFRDDSPEIRQVVGTLVIERFPGKGTLLVNGIAIDSLASSQRFSVSLPGGTHNLAWRSDKGIIWREKCRILPFQTLALSVWPRQG